jgi:transposase InsO family protein
VLGVNLDYPGASISVRPARDRRDGKLFPLATDEGLDHRVGVHEIVHVMMDSLAKLIRQRGWRRPRRRVYPEKPKTGIRAMYPNEYWHIDATIIQFLDGTKAYLHAVIDNFSRRILSWRLAERLEPSTTCEILTVAGKNLDLTLTV